MMPVGLQWLDKLWARWDHLWSIIVLLATDTLLAEVQVIYFLAHLLWSLRNAYIEQCFDTVKLNDEYGFQQFPSYNSIRVYFIAIGALNTRIFVNLILFDGILSGVNSEIRTGIIGSACTTVYIFIAGFIFWIYQYLKFKLLWWFMALMLFGLTVYTLVSAYVLTLMWAEQRAGAVRQHFAFVGATYMLSCGVVVVFIQVQIILWSVNKMWEPIYDNAKNLVFLIETGRYSHE